ncbi:MAG: family 20 glycosylhydrolase, partial [Pedobacter sp.]|nr:family 20 glycosylhydrolase [Chitinophagaceae bacterium]
GDGYEGTFYGMQSLIGLLPIAQSQTSNHKLVVPCLVINDAPRFAYRGMHLDVSRHFFGVDYVKKYIDFIALHKMNYFHWHLTDDQGWRIEIKKYPKLTSVGGYRNGTIIGRYPGTGNDSLKYGGFYTQEQIKDVVKYAAERFITIVPEIDVPGHSLAAIVAYPELSTTPNVPKQVGQTWGLTDINNVLNPSDTTFAFLENVLSEVIDLFPSKYIHIGGDECNKRWWRESAFCQDLMQKEGLKNTDALQSYFIHRIEKIVNNKGRLMMGWDEILEGGLAPNALVMSWQGEKGGIEAAKQKHQVVMTPGTYCYLDHSQTKNEDSITIGSYLPVEKVYNYNPVPAELSAEEAKYILGAQGNVWTEYIGNESKLEYMVFPRMSALSEAVWTEQKNKNLPDFEQRLQQQFKRYDFWKVNSSKAYYDIQSTILPTKNNEGLIWKATSKLKDGHLLFYEPNEIISHNKKNDSLTASILKSGTYKINLDTSTRDSKDLSSPLAGSVHISSLPQTFSFNLATGKKITLTNPPAVQYPGNGGAFGLVNGVTSTKGINSAEWLGFNGKDMEAIIDLGKAQTFTTVTLDALLLEGSWIYLPSSVEIFTSTNGKDFKLINNTSYNTVTANKQSKLQTLFSAETAQYIKIIAHNSTTIQLGKPGAGKPAWLFVDEIVVE